MSEDKSLRLDPKTLRHVADRLRAGLDSVRDLLAPDGSDAHFTKCILDMVAEAEELAAEAEKLPPAHSDWMKACEGTGLGEPVAAVFDRTTWGVILGRHHIGLADHGDTGEDVTALLYKDGEEPTICRTPAELRAALEALTRRP